MNSVDSLREILQSLVDVRGAPGTTLTTHGYAYGSIEEFVLKHGEEFTPAGLPEEYEPMETKLCYTNAYLMATVLGLEYVEGYAFGPGILGLPILHAWNVDHDGRLLDFTWESLGVGEAYLGIRLPFSLARNGPVLDDWKNRWPLLRNPWKGGAIALTT